MEFFSLLLALISLWLVFSLRKRVEKLEQGTRPPTTNQAPVSYAPKQPLAAAVATTAPATTSTSYPESFHSDAPDKFIAWVQEDWLLKLGALLLLIGFGWFATYAFLNNWIGPMGRIVLGIVAGVLILLLGWWRIQKYLHQGGVFLVLGSTTILLTIFAAREVYDFFTPLTALVVMFLSSAFVAAASVKFKSRSLALASLVLAGVAPLLTSSPSPDYVGLFSYLFVVILGAIWIVVLTGNRELTAAALILVTFYSLPHLTPFSFTDSSTLLLFAYAFAAVFFITNTAGILKLRDKAIIPDLVTAAGNGLFLLAWIMTAAPEEWRSLIIALWMVVFLVGAFVVFRLTQKREPFYVYAGVGIAMLAAATSAELSGATLTLAYTIESGLVAVVAFLVLRDVKVAHISSLLLAGPMVLSVNSMISPAWRTGVLHEDFFVLGALTLMLFGLGLFFWSEIKTTGDQESAQFNVALLVGGSVYAFLLIWLCAHALLVQDDRAVMFSLVVYTLVGLATYFYGQTKEHRGFRIYGGAVLGFVVVRLLTIDVWKMALSGRIITFFLVGALLMSTAFLGRAKKNRVTQIQ